MFFNVAEQQSEIVIEIFELSDHESEHVAGGPEQPNDPGH